MTLDEFLPEITDWREAGSCWATDADTFFPAGDSAKEAKKVCWGHRGEGDETPIPPCPVREVCLEYSLVTNQEAGVWGGYAERERRKLRKRWLRAGRRFQE